MLASPDQTVSTGFSLTLPAVRTESQHKAPVHLCSFHALRLSVQARSEVACTTAVPLCHPPGGLLRGMDGHSLGMAHPCSSVPQVILELSLTNIVGLISAVWLVIILKIFRFSLLVTNTLLQIIASACCMFILTSESCDNILLVPDIQGG